MNSLRLASQLFGLVLLGATACAARAQDASTADAASSDSKSYQLGHGWALGGGFNLGGYVSASIGQFSAPAGSDSDWRGALDSLSVMLSWNDGGRWSAFSEFEIEESAVVESGTWSSDPYLDIERLYLDYAYSDALNVRIGKFLTPVGRWNQIHAAPLTWTTSRPLITEATFPTNATGAMVHGTLPGLADTIEYSLYVSPGKELRPDPDIDPFQEAYGGHLNLSLLKSLNVGLSFVDFEQQSNADEHKKLYSVDFAWQDARWEVSGEFALRSTNLTLQSRDEYGGYLQVVAPLSERLYAVARYENFRDSSSAQDLNLYLGGLNFRWGPAVVLKAEYSRATDNDLGVRDGALASVSVLF